MLKKIGPSLGHVGLALLVQGVIFLALSPFIGGKAALIAGSCLATGWFFAREIEQIYPHFPRFGMPPLPPEKVPTIGDWTRAARQALYPSIVTIVVAVYFYNHF